MDNGVLINNIQSWYQFIEGKDTLSNVVVQDVNFKKENIDWSQFTFDNTSFLNCKFKKGQAIELISHGAFVYPKFSNLPYKPNRTKLYTHQELLKGYHPQNDRSKDLKIYNHFIQHRFTPPIYEAMAQRIHDFNIDEALRSLLKFNKKGMTYKKAVGFMGGHSTRRGSEYYINTAVTAKLLAQNEYYIVSGGGPGVMEAANLGAYMSHKSDDDLFYAIDILSELTFEDGMDKADQKDYYAKNYVTNAQRVLHEFPEGAENLAIPTWFYGHEPTNVFASHIAKYFSNSIREDTLLAISLYGVVFAPGSAGTTQEIFQEAAQNHYGTFGYYSPMVFLGKKRYVEDTALYSVLHQLAEGQKYKDLLCLTDDPQTVLSFIQNNPPIAVGSVNE